LKLAGSSKQTGYLAYTLETTNSSVESAEMRRRELSPLSWRGILLIKSTRSKPSDARAKKKLDCR